jgi:hypothetical protein
MATAISERIPGPRRLTLARTAIRHNESHLKTQHANIINLMPAFDVGGGQRAPCVHVCIHDENHRNIPLFLDFPDRNGRIRQVKVHVISKFGPIEPQAGNGDMLFNPIRPALIGTLGCIVQSTSSGVCALTCNHVMTGKAFQNSATPGQIADERLGGASVPLGPWISGKMNTSIDVAVIGVTNAASVKPNGLASTTPITVQDADCGVTQVSLQGAVSHQRAGFIIHKGQSMPVNYAGQQVTLTGLVTLSAGNSVSNFSPVTQDGDSGALVFDAAKRQPIGLVLGANLQFTYVMPIGSILSAFAPLGLNIIL